jgi:hypothetical protein
LELWPNRGFFCPKDQLCLDIGVWMSPAVLEHKLEAQDEPNPEQAWNLSRWPKDGFPAGQKHRLFVASAGVWCGYFILAGEALYNLEDPNTPYTLIFDTRTWTEIPPVPVRRFRGFTYNVPTTGPQTVTGPPVA